jgi:DNA-binding MarR family transcriptional regulator
MNITFDQQLIRNLGDLHFHFNVFMSQVLSKQEGPKINMNQLRMLNFLRKEKVLTANELAELIDVTPPSMTKHIEYLESGGFIQKTQEKSDKRQYNLRLTNKGRKKVKTLVRKIVTDMAERSKHLSKEEKESVVSGIEILNEIFER